jgi:ABC-2 type transport system permease protein
MFSLYLRMIGASIRGQMQYKIAFWIDLIGFLVTSGIEFVVIAILFMRFDSIAGWSIYEVGLLYALTNIAFSLAEMVMRGFDAPFETMMQRGSFDGVLIRPLDSFFQIMSSEFQLRRLGRTSQAVAVLIFALSNLSINWSFSNIILFLLTIISGVIIYSAMSVIGATFCFWTIKTPEVINAFTHGGNQMTSYPISIYNTWMRRIFLMVIPTAFTNYPTALVLLNRTDPHGLPAQIAWAAPVVALLFFGVARLFWQYGVNSYQSTGS